MSSEPKFTIYVKTTSNCVQCDQTIKRLNKMGLYEGEDFNVESAEDNLDFIKTLNYQQAPVVVVDTSKVEGIQPDWSGFRPDLLKKISSLCLVED